MAKWQYVWRTHWGRLLYANTKCPHTNSIKGFNCWQEQHWASSMETITSSIGRLGINPSRGQAKILSRVSLKLFLVEHKRSSLPRGQYWPSSHVNLGNSITQAVRNNIKWKFLSVPPRSGGVLLSTRQRLQNARAGLCSRPWMEMKMLIRASTGFATLCRINPNHPPSHPGLGPWPPPPSTPPADLKRVFVTTSQCLGFRCQRQKRDFFSPPPPTFALATKFLEFDSIEKQRNFCPNFKVKSNFCL